MPRPTLLETVEALGDDVNFEGIPILDLSLPDDELVEPLRDACLRAGFFYVKNHAVDEELVTATFSRARALFNESGEDVKKQVSIEQSSDFKGYMGLLSENVNPENKGDMHEAFNCGPEDRSAPPERIVLDADGKTKQNLWPTESGKLEGFRHGVLEYFYAVAGLGHRLFPLIALALDLPRNYFADKTSTVAGIMRLLHYPHQDGPVDEKIQGIGSHTDYEAITILRQQDGIEALEVLNRKGEWISAPAIPGTFVINLGDMLARWSNDIFVSTRHRASNRSGRERYSIPFFLSADYDSTIEPFHTCVSDKRPARYGPVSAGAYLQQRLAETYHYSAAPEAA